MTARGPGVVAALLLLLLAVVPLARAETLTFQAGVTPHGATSDTWLQGSSGAADHSNDTILEWDGEDGGGENFALLRFDAVFGSAPGQIQPTDTITSATLRYVVTNAGEPATVNEVLVDWSPPDPVTYDTFGGEPGVQADEFGQEVAIALGGSGEQTIDVTSSIVLWALDPALNHGWIFRPSGGTNGVQFRSSEDGSSSNRPLLTVVVNEGTPPPAVVVRGPYLQLATSGSIVVRWRTDVATTSRVRYGSAPGNLPLEVVDDALVLDHEITVAGLAPATLYYYSVGTSDVELAGNTPEHRFRTAPVPGAPEPLRVWAIGDFGTADSAQYDVRDAYYDFTGATPTDVWLMLGDNAYDSGSDAEYQQAVFAVYGDLLIQTPFWATRGNHEMSATVHYGLVTNPTGGEAGGLPSGTEAYFSFDHANVHFICLDSEGSDRAPGGAMMQWLENDLASTDQDWVVGYWHHPPYSKGTHDSDDVSDSGGRMFDMRETALQILEDGGADLVLSGHSHVFERSFLIDGHYGTSGTFDPDTMLLDGGDGRPGGDGAYVKDSAPHDGTVCVVMGSSGKLGTGPLNHPAMFMAVSERGSLVLDFDGNVLNATMVRDDGAIQDTFTIVKSLAAPVLFRRGDCDGDGSIGLADPLFALSWLFGGAVLPACLDACDSNDDGQGNISDPIFALTFLFAGGSPFPAPYPGCGADPTPDGLGCSAFLACP